MRFLLVINALAPILHRTDGGDAPVKVPPSSIFMDSGGALVEERSTVGQHMLRVRAKVQAERAQSGRSLAGHIRAGTALTLPGQRRRAGRGAQCRGTASVS